MNSTLLSLLKLAPLLLLVLLLGGCAIFKKRLHARASRLPPSKMDECLSPGARQLMEDSLRGLDLDRVTDYHAHLITREVNPKWLSWTHPKDYAGNLLLTDAAGVRFDKDFDAAYLNRLAALIQSSPIHGKVFLFAMDKFHDSDGNAVNAKTTFHVPNDAVFDAVSKYPNLFVPVVSIHPYRKDAIAELERCARRGSRYVKWIPNSMGIDPASPKTEAFYHRMRELHMVLICHTGSEPIVETSEGRDFGNPLRLRKPLGMGVRVIACHCASWGTDIDFESPGGKRVQSFDLFLRLMDEPAYRGLLFGDISAVTFFTRGDIITLAERVRLVLLERTDLQERLVYGSDYPICGIKLMTLTSRLAHAGFITTTQGKQLNEIYRYNPWLFDLVLKRTLRHPETGQRFADSIFMMRPELQ